MKKCIIMLVLTVGLIAPVSAQILPAPGSQCNIGLILKQFDFCGYGYIRFSTTAISGATYTWNVLGTSVGGTTTTNYFDVLSSQLTNGTYTMSVRATCQINNCTEVSEWRFLTFTVTCGGFPRKDLVLETPAIATTFDGLDLAEMLNNQDLFRAHHELIDDALLLTNLSGETGRFHVVTIDHDRFITTRILDLAAGEARELVLDANAVEAYVLSPKAFAAYNYDQEWLSERPLWNHTPFERK